MSGLLARCRPLLASTSGRALAPGCLPARSAGWLFVSRPVLSAGMDLKDIPDRWKRFNPETPPYKYFPGRTRQQTMWYSWCAIVGFMAIGWFLVEVVERANEGKQEMYDEYARQHMSFEQASQINAQAEALKAIMMKARRQRLGLPDEKHGSVQMVDPFED
eukprot:TRINITY_DN40280_c0_g1_i1.p1 TRINITY_DN40280_c0_g1~~TRINITY_DN40280_c0_g1_i1.p1  ORF type:complete len:161 (+),score=38.80 TRINITY_DN40280_c0_g1_i1:69-551(+)